MTISMARNIRNIPVKIAQWLRDDPHPEYIIMNRSVTIRTKSDGKLTVVLSGLDAGDKHIMIPTTIDESESGGGSAPDGWTRAINAFKEAAGKTVRRGVR